MFNITSNEVNTNQNHNGLSPYTGYYRKKEQKITSVGEDVEKL
jgi:hypothetical protein